MAWLENLLAVLTAEEKVRLVVGVEPARIVPGAAGETRAVRIVPSITLTDGPSSVRIEGSEKVWYYTTAFPAPIMLASTWNPDVVERIGKAMAEEAKYYGVSVLLAPGLNIHRHPMCGRNFEYFSEDPLLSGRMVAAFVRGVQSVGSAILEPLRITQDLLCTAKTYTLGTDTTTHTVLSQHMNSATDCRTQNLSIET
jgi:beta-glucosidase